MSGEQVEAKRSAEAQKKRSEEKGESVTGFTICAQYVLLFFLRVRYDGCITALSM